MGTNKSIEKQADWLIFFGILLFFFGLVIGLFIPLMINQRMGLSAHLEGIMNGIFLIVLGLIWNKLFLSEKWLQIVFGLVVYGSFTNIIAVLIAALTGFGKMMPIAGGQEGTPFIENIISFLLVSLSLVMLAVCILLLIGFYKFIKQKRNE